MNLTCVGNTSITFKIANTNNVTPLNFTQKIPSDFIAIQIRLKVNFHLEYRFLIIIFL